MAAASSQGADPCSLIATKTQLYVANVCFQYHHYFYSQDNFIDTSVPDSQNRILDMKD